MPIYTWAGAIEGDKRGVTAGIMAGGIAVELPRTASPLPPPQW